MDLRENVFLICDGYSVMSFLAVQALLFPSAVGLVSVMSGRKNDREYQGGSQKLMENTNEIVWEPELLFWVERISLLLGIEVMKVISIT